jgi:hypothetical protein
MNRVILKRWFGVRCYIARDRHHKTAKLEPDEDDLAELKDPFDLVRFWRACLEWSVSFEARHPTWKINGAKTDERDDPEEHQHYYKV